MPERITVRLADAVYSHLADAAKAGGLDLSAFVRQALTSYLDHQGSGPHRPGRQSPERGGMPQPHPGRLCRDDCTPLPTRGASGDSTWRRTAGPAAGRGVDHPAGAGPEPPTRGSSSPVALRIAQGQCWITARSGAGSNGGCHGAHGCPPHGDVARHFAILDRCTTQPTGVDA
jgi:hypothetical protein